MTVSAPDPIFTVIGEFQARLAIAAHAQSPAATSAQQRADAALLETRATTAEGLHAGMCFRIEAAAQYLEEADHELADPTWRILQRAAAGRSVAVGLCGVVSVLEPGFFTDLLRAALCDALELEQGAGGREGVSVDVQAAA